MPSLALPMVSADLELSGVNYSLVFAVAAIAIVALVMGVVFRQQVLAADTGTDNMREIGGAVEEGAQAYLNRQFKTLGGFVEWFEAKSGEDFGGVTCRDITGGGVGRRLEHCPGLISDSFEKCMEILREKGVV